MVFPLPLQAQITNVTDDTSTPIPGAGHNYLGELNEAVNPANGSVSLRLQVPVPPGRRLTVPFSFEYNTSGIQHPGGTAGHMSWGNDLGYLSKGGWSYAVPRISVIKDSKSVPPPPYPPGQQGEFCNFFSYYMLQDLEGQRHALGLSVGEKNTYSNWGICPPAGLTGDYLSGGDDYYQDSTSAIPSGHIACTPPVNVVDADGTVYYFSNPYTHIGELGYGDSLPSWIEDRNGNQALFQDSGNGAFTITDTAGRAAVQSSGFGDISGDMVTMSGLSPYHINWETVQFSYFATGVDLGGGSYCSGFGGGTNGTLTSIQQIELPNGQSYFLKYGNDDPNNSNPYGLLSQISYPTGGWVKYTWGMSSPIELLRFDDSAGHSNA
ncbi:MAG: hypothetical protein DMG22_03615 [Acidobacteria bacterium]|nr:MAG: hypothetical protein DMG22_03615 [Acidobacteriota bacterium]